MVETILEAEEAEAEELSVRFVSAEEMSKLHEEHFDDPTLTDCLSFPMDEPGPGAVLGDVVVCPKAALLQETEPYEEVTLYLVHALLHLLGYDDINEEDRKAMRRAEGRLMVLLKNKEQLLGP